MYWMQSYTGRKIDVLNIAAADICVEDIAHALSMTCRFRGHVPQFYSVAQHSILCAQFCESSCPTDRLWCLLHDAPEAYLADLSSPVKHGIRDQLKCSVFDDVDKRIMAAVCERFGLPKDEPECVKRADVLLLATEWKFFFGDTSAYAEWQHRPELGFHAVTPCCIAPMSWQDAEIQFMRAFRELACGRGATK